MKIRIPFPVGVLAAALLGLAVGVPVEAATTLVVDDDGFASATNCNDPTTAAYSTISAAVAAASPGDTIKVCPGLYAEQVTIGQNSLLQTLNNLTLLGPQAGVDARTRAFVPATEAIIDDPCGPVQIEADNVTLDGFTVQGSVLDPTVFSACFGAGIWSNPGYSGTQGGHQIFNNIVQNNISGIELDSTCTNATLVQFNLIQNNNNPGAGSGNGIQTSFGLCNATIDSNKFSGHLNTSMLLNTAQSKLVISNNELVGGTPERIFLANTTASSITGNVSVGSTSSGTIRLFSDNSDLTINSNTLLNGMRGIRVDDLDLLNPAANSNIKAHFNCIKGNSLAGLEVAAGDHTGTLNAEDNWWGNSTGPTNANNPGGTGDAVVAPDNNVDFIPFLTSPPGPPCPAAPNTPGKATGGGKIESSNSSTILDTVLDLATILIMSSSSPTSVGGQATFGFSVACCAPKGNLQYNDHGANISIKATSIMTFVITTPSAACPTNSSGKHAQFKGMAEQSDATGSVTFTVDVDDCGEPGSSTAGGVDMFSISTTAGYSASGPLIGGNIQIKPAQ